MLFAAISKTKHNPRKKKCPNQRWTLDYPLRILSLSLSLHLFIALATMYMYNEIPFASSMCACVCVYGECHYGHLKYIVAWMREKKKTVTCILRYMPGTAEAVHRTTLVDINSNVIIRGATKRQNLLNIHYQDENRATLSVWWGRRVCCARCV